MSGGEGGDTHDVDVVVDGLAGDLLGGLEEAADVDVEAEVGEARRDDLGAAVVAVLAHLRDQDARVAPLRLRERLHHAQSLLELRLAPVARLG